MTRARDVEARNGEERTPAREPAGAAALDRLLAAASGLAATIADTEALLQKRADILTEPTVAMRASGGRRSELVPLSEVAKRVGRHPEVLRRWCADGRVKAVRIGRTWWIHPETVAVLVAHGNRSRPRLPPEAVG